MKQSNNETMKKKIWFWYLLLILILLITVVLPLFTSHIPGTADGLAHKFRLVAFDKAIDEGILRPRWLALPALGYGAPIFLFNYILPYYIVDAFYRFGVSLNKSVQVYEAMTLAGSFITMYLLGLKLWGKRAGLVVATVYAWAPYHLLSIYLYEGWGEMGAFVFPPLILYLILKLFDKGNLGFNVDQKSKIKNQKQSVIISFFNFKLGFDLCTLIFALLVVSWFLFILTHNVSVVMFSPVLLVAAFCLSGFNPRKWFMVLLAFATACLISSFFSIPAILLNRQINYINLINQEILMRGQYFKSIHSMFEIAFLSIRNGVTYYLDFTIGLPILVVITVTFLRVLPFILSLSKGSHIKFSRSQDNNIPLQRCHPGPACRQAGETNPSSGWPRFDRGWRIKSRSILNFGHLGFDIISNFKFQISNFIIVIFILLLFSLFLSNAASDWIWKLNLLDYIVYPFRFLFLATFAGSLLAGFMTRKSTVAATLLIILAVAQGFSYTRPWVEIFPFPDDYFLQPQTITYTPKSRKNPAVGEFLPRSVNIKFLQGIEKSYLAGGILPEKLVLDDEGGKIVESKVGVENITAKIQTGKSSTLTVNTNYFPNWEAYIDDVRTPIRADTDGRISLGVPGGTHKFRLIFGISPVEKTANLLSIAGVGIFILEILWLSKSGRSLSSRT